MSTEPPTTSRLPLVVYILAIGTFLMGTTELMMVGLLPEIAEDLGVSVGHAGLLITIFAVGMIVGAPTMVILTRRLPRRLTLALALAVFAALHLVVALGSGFGLLLGARFLIAWATGAFWSVAAVVAACAAGPAASARAIGVVIGGGMLATVVGVPLGAFAGQLLGWRGPFWALAVLAAIAAAVILRFVPHDNPDRRVPSITSELSGLRSRQLWLVLVSSTFILGGVMATYSYIAPLLTVRAGLPSNLVPLALVGFGAGALLGTVLGGRAGDTRPYLAALTAVATTVTILVGLCFLSQQALATVVLVILLGLAGMAANPVLMSLAVRFAGGAPTLASALSASAFNIGIAGGSWIAGLVLESSLNELGPPVVGVAIATLTLFPLAALAIGQRTKPASTEPHFTDPAGEDLRPRVAAR